MLTFLLAKIDLSPDTWHLLGMITLCGMLGIIGVAAISLFAPIF